MEPQNDSISMRKTVRVDCDGEKARHFKEQTKQRGPNDNDVSVFTSASNEIESNLAPQNGPCSRNLNTTNSDSSESSHLASDSTECNKIFSASQCNKVNNCNSTLLAVPGPSKSENNVFDNNKDIQSCQKHKVFLDKVGNSSCNIPSTSGINKVFDNGDSNSIRENRKRPSTLKLNRPPVDADDSSSDTGNDDYSLGSEDGCIYTYRGGEHLADLPSSFFSLDMGLPLDKHLPHAPNYAGHQQAANARENNSGASSPDMDFLEMDFDPGPSCEADTGDESSPDIAINMPEENKPIVRGTSPEYMAAVRYNPLACVPTTSTANYADSFCSSLPSTSQAVSSDQQDKQKDSENGHSYGPFITHVNVRGEQLLVHRTMSDPITVATNSHSSNEDLLLPQDISNYDEEHPEGPYACQINQGRPTAYVSRKISSALYHETMARKLIEDASHSHAIDLTTEPGSNGTEESNCSLPPRCMVWSEREACERQVTQIGPSAGGATAVVNAFIALGVPVDIEKINSSIGTRLRANDAPLPRYLLSRAVAGCTAADLVTGIQRASDGLVTARFFPTYPERAMSLSHWLADWISLGAVPIATLNLQMSSDGDIPDSWHHQMVFGVSQQGVYLCNPAQCVRESTLWPQLTSPSVLLVRARDILTRYTLNMDLTPLMMVPDRRFHSFNVLGQVVYVIREWRSNRWFEYGTRTRHIRIPAAYQAGITVAALTGSEAHRRLMHAPQLPVIGPQTDR